jgi:hypothetical protein
MSSSVSTVVICDVQCTGTDSRQRRCFNLRSCKSGPPCADAPPATCPLLQQQWQGHKGKQAVSQHTATGAHNTCTRPIRTAIHRGKDGTHTCLRPGSARRPSAALSMHPAPSAAAPGTAQPPAAADTRTHTTRQSLPSRQRRQRCRQPTATSRLYTSCDMHVQATASHSLPVSPAAPRRKQPTMRLVPQ